MALYFGGFLVQHLLCRLKLKHDAGESLSHRVVNLSRHAVALLKYYHISRFLEEGCVLDGDGKLISQRLCR